MVVPTLPFDEAALITMLAGNPLIMLGLCFLAGLVAGKQEHDNAAKTNPDGTVTVTDPSRRNLTIWDWLEDGAYGFFGGLVGYGLIEMGMVQVPITLLPIAGYAGRKLVMMVADKFAK